MKTYSRPLSNSNWTSAGAVNKFRLGANGKAHGPYETVDFQFDTAPGNERSRLASIEFSREEIINLAAEMCGGDEHLIAALARSCAHKLVEAISENRELQKSLTEKTKANEELEAKHREAAKFRAIGGAL